MSDTVSWKVTLHDQVSDPATKMMRALGPLDAGIGRLGTSLDAATRKIDRFSPKGAGGTKLLKSPLSGKLFNGLASGPPQVDKLAGALDKVDPAAGKAESGLSSMLSVAGAAGTIVAAAAAAIGKVAAVVFGPVNWSIDLSSFKQDSIAGFKMMAGTSAEGERLFGRAVELAASTPLSVDEAVGNYKKLLAAGFKKAQLDKVILATGDVGAVMGAEKMEQFSSALVQIQAKGKLSGDTLEQLASAGVSQGAVYEALAKSMGKTIPQVKKLVSAGKVNGDQGVEAITTAIEKTISGGVVGSAMSKKSDTFSGVLSSVVDIPKLLMAKSDMSQLLNPIQWFMEKLTAFFDPKALGGQRLIAFFESTGAKIGDLFRGIEFKDIERTFNTIMGVVEPTVNGILAFVKGARSSFGAIFSEFQKGMEKMGPNSFEKLMKGLEMIGKFEGANFAMIVMQLSMVATYVGYAATTLDRFAIAAETVFKGLRLVEGALESVIGKWDRLKSIGGPLMPDSAPKIFGGAREKNQMMGIGIDDGSTPQWISDGMAPSMFGWGAPGAVVANGAPVTNQNVNAPSTISIFVGSDAGAQGGTDAANSFLGTLGDGLGSLAHEFGG